MTAENKNRRTLGGLIALAILTTVGLVIFTMYGARYVSLHQFRSKPPLHLVPHERVVGPAGVFPGTLFSAYGYSFQPPWVGVASRIQTQSLSGLIFHTGQVFQVRNPAMVIDWRSELTRPGNTYVLDKLTAAFGNACCETNYAIVERILFASPAQLRFLQSAKQSMAIGILLTYKSAYVNEDTIEIFAFHSRRLKGFQLGNPARSKSVRLVVFPKEGSELWMDISSTSAGLRQEEVDRIIASIGRQSN
ncbi:MAG: hypothetical protein AMJ54_01165 [Deltaproteobacteria bacterium SG8_13]|nr:MAG: hypothetical protein AMJ54_01165 [Deltaproteobacteria bacterium SG8_13]